MKKIILLLLLFVLAGCIEDYDAKTNGIDNILVVEGMITSGTTQIKLSKSIGLDADYWLYNWGVDSSIFVKNALVYVECDDGSKSETVRSSDGGICLIETGELKVDKKYRTVIQYEGEEYHSSFIAPAISPPVELSYRINYNINNKGDTIGINSIDVLVSTQGFENQPRYYMWSYQEDWEINSYLGWDKCWRTDNSRYLMLGTSERLTVNAIKDRPICTISPQNDRISELYRIRVKQNLMHQEGYDYMENLNRNSREIGDIFGPIPSELMGNIRCFSNPKIPVIGYVDVSTITTEDLYLTNEYFDTRYRISQIMACNNQQQEHQEQQQEPPKPPVWCTDCTNQGGTKIKPIDWPR